MKSITYSTKYGSGFATNYNYADLARNQDFCKLIEKFILSMDRSGYFNISLSEVRKNRLLNSHYEELLNNLSNINDYNSLKEDYKKNLETVFLGLDVVKVTDSRSGIKIYSYDGKEDYEILHHDYCISYF